MSSGTYHCKAGGEGWTPFGILIKDIYTHPPPPHSGIELWNTRAQTSMSGPFPNIFVLNIFYCLPSSNLILIHGSHNQTSFKVKKGHTKFNTELVQDVDMDAKTKSCCGRKVSMDLGEHVELWHPTMSLLNHGGDCGSESPGCPPPVSCASSMSPNEQFVKNL